MIFNEDFFVSASRDKSIKIWDRKTFKVIDKKEFKTGGHRNSVNQVLPTDENTFVSCSDDSRIIIWANK
jgi:WD40 repeat protein